MPIYFHSCLCSYLSRVPILVEDTVCVISVVPTFMCRLRINLITNVSEESQKICENFFSHCHQCCILNTPTALIGLTVLSALWLARDRSEGRKHAEPRRVVLRKTQVDLGLKICGGNLTGVFVEALEEDSPARGADGLQPGDLILEVLVHHKQPHVTLFDSVLDGVVMSFPVCSVTRWVWRIRPRGGVSGDAETRGERHPQESRTDPSTSGGSKSTRRWFLHQVTDSNLSVCQSGTVREFRLEYQGSYGVWKSMEFDLSIFQVWKSMEKKSRVWKNS